MSLERSRERLRGELIQAAAVATAIIEDLDYGQARWDGETSDNDLGELEFQVEPVLRQIKAERVRQDAKWGPQHHDPEDWMLILMEEVGEVADEIPYKAGHPGSGLLWEISRIGNGAKATLEGRGLG